MTALTLLHVAALALTPLATTETPAAQAAKAADRAVLDLGPMLAPHVEKSKLPGLVAAVVRGGEVVALGAAGVRKHGDPTPIKASDRMHLGSCTKAMTATLAARMVEDGLLRWNSTLAELFPDVEMLPAWRAVTLEQLLTNRSGAPADLKADGLWARLWKQEGTTTDQRRALLLGVVKREPESPPGTKFLYSNAGFAIAGHALETLAKQPWEKLIQKELFAPLGITTAGFGAPGKKGKLDAPLGHVENSPREVGPAADNPPAIGPAGTVHMNIADWAKFVGLHLDAARGKPRLLSKEGFAKLHTSPPSTDTQYAMGWAVQKREWSKEALLTHSGSNTMWFCVTWIAPEHDFAVLVATNEGGGDVSRSVDAVVWELVQAELARGKKETR